MEADAEQRPKYYQLEDGLNQGQSVGSNLNSPAQSTTQQLLAARGATEGPRHGRSLSIESRSTASESPERSVRDPKEGLAKEMEGGVGSLRKRLTAVVMNAAT
jgi:hypothetical protein